MSDDQAEGPELLMAGDFALYRGTGGTMVLVTQIPTYATEDNPTGLMRRVIPAAIVKLAGGKLARMLGGDKEWDGSMINPPR